MLVYAKIRSIHTEARHVICACRVPGRKFHTCQDFVDDDEHARGAFLLRLLTDSEIQNRVLLVVREYDGQHIGSRRFEAMLQVAKSAVDRAPENRFTKRHDCIWEREPEANQWQSSSVRGRGRRTFQKRNPYGVTPPFVLNQGSYAQVVGNKDSQELDQVNQAENTNAIGSG